MPESISLLTKFAEKLPYSAPLEPVFKDWLRKDSKDKTKAHCAVCHKTFELSSSFRSSITDHGKRKKHLEELRKVNSFFSPQKKKDESNSASQISALETPKPSSATADIGLLY